MDIYNLFSNPFEGDYKPLVSQLATTQYLVILGHAQKLGELLNREPDPLLALIRDRVKQSPASTVYWIPEISTAFHGRDHEPCEGVYDWSRAQLIVAGFLCGVLDNFSLEVDKLEQPLYMGGYSHNGKMSIKGETDRLVCLDEAGNDSLTLTCLGLINGKFLWARDGMSDLLIKQDGKPLIRLADGSWSRSWGGELREVGSLEAAVPQFEEALSFLKENLPEYYGWVAHVTTELTPLRRPGHDTIGSSSCDNRWGGLNISSPASVIETVEMLIHESSHQYFHLFSMLAPITDLNAPEYYSPLKNRKRPLDRILLGYHAFANASLAFELLEELGYAKELRMRKESVDNYMKELCIPLESEEGIAELGLALYRPVRKRIAHLFYGEPVAVGERPNGVNQTIEQGVR